MEGGQFDIAGDSRNVAVPHGRWWAVVISEQVCLDIIGLLHGSTSVLTTTDHTTDPPAVKKSEDANALTDSGLVRPLLAKYDLADIDTAIRWLTLGGYVGRAEYGLRGPWVHTLTDKGLDVATNGRFPDEERELFNLVMPHLVFLAHQFTDDDSPLERHIRARLDDAGYEVVDGKVDGLEPFRHAILQKITKARFFLCLLTRRSELAAGGYVSSVWLYQEIGAAVAVGRAPLLLVESGMDPHYAGELQKTYEYIPFERDKISEVLPEVVRRFDVDLERHAIPLPVSRVASRS